MTSLEYNQSSQETLEAFFRDHEQTAIELNRLLKLDLIEDSYPLVHALKGAAGVLNLEPLYSLCQSFPRNPGANDRDRLYQIIDALNATLREIVRKLPVSGAPADEDEVTTFRRMLRQHNFKAIVMVRNWKHKPNPFTEAELTELTKQLEQFDFKAAAESTEAFLGSPDKQTENKQHICR